MPLSGDEGGPRHDHGIEPGLIVRPAAVGGVVAVAGGYLLASANGWYRATDFACLWSAARLVLAGSDPYDTAVWRAATTAQLGVADAGPCFNASAYPLWTALAMAPFGALALEPAAVAWMALGLAATALGSLLCWRAAGGARREAPLFAALVATAQPLWILLISGQITGVLAGLAGAAAFALARGRPVVGGAALSGLLLKPQIGILPIAVAGFRALRDRHPRVLAGIVLPAVGAALVSLGVRPTWPLEWIETSFDRRLDLAPRLPTAWGLSAELTGSVLLAPVLIALVSLGVVVLMRSRPVGDAELLAVTIPLGLFAVPHVWSYDFLVLVVPWAVALAAAGRARPQARWPIIAATVLVAAVLPRGLYALAFSRGTERLSAVIPAFTALLAAAAIRSAPQGPVLRPEGYGHRVYPA